MLDSTYPLYGYFGLGDGYNEEFMPWLEQWLDGRGINPYYNGPDSVGYSDVLPEPKTFSNEQWIKAITDNVDGIINPPQ